MATPKILIIYTGGTIGMSRSTSTTSFPPCLSSNS